MDREEILSSSRKENKNKDLAELEIVRTANNVGAVAGGIASCLVIALASMIANVTLYSPWVIYFSIIGANWLTRAIKLKKKSDWALACTFIILASLSLVGLIIRLIEVGA